MSRTRQYEIIPDAYLNDEGHFKQGYDARYQTDLISTVLMLDNPDALHRFTKVDAIRRIRSMGWEHLLEYRARAIRNRQLVLENTRGR